MSVEKKQLILCRIMWRNNVRIKKYNKTVSFKNCNSIDPCKPYVASAILFLLISVIITGAFVYFYVNSHSKRKLQDYYKTYYY